MTENTSNAKATQTPQPESKKTSGKVAAKKTLLWAVGITPAVMLGREIKSTASIVTWALRNIVQTFSLNREQAKEDLKLAKASPDEFWDEVVASARVTEQSLRKRYALATYGAYACLAAMSIATGILATYEGAAAVTVGNIALINILLIIYINHLHKLYTARHQKIIPTLAFMKELLKSPALMIPQPLPADYKLRTKPKPAAATGG